MYTNSFFKKLILVASIILFVSCDKEYNMVGDSLIGDNHFDFKSDTISVLAYNQKIEPIQSHNLPVNALGIYDDPTFGKTIANFATQVQLASVAPTIGDNPKIKSVILEIPYFSHITSTNATDGSHVYELDSIYGKDKAKINLSIYESGHDMNDRGETKLFYTNQTSVYDKFKGVLLNDAPVKDQNNEFFFNPAEQTTLDEAGTVTARTAPGMKLYLNNNYFLDKILKAPSDKLAKNEVFTEYFKGLYFKVEQSGSNTGSLSMLDFSKGKITINYTTDVTSTTTNPDGSTTPVITKTDNSMVLNLAGNKVSLLERTNTSTYDNALKAVNSTKGDGKLYLKGGQGSLAVIELFGPDLDGNKVPDQLDNIRKNKWLINQANLVFTIDAATLKMNSYEPDRIYVYDYTNTNNSSTGNSSLIDYIVDANAGATVKTNKPIFDGIINIDANKRGTTYRVRITNHIRNLVKNLDSKNVKLGVVVTEDINTSVFNYLTGSTTSGAPLGSVMSPLGTVLFGNNIPFGHDDYAKRLKLEIYYTKPN